MNNNESNAKNIKKIQTILDKILLLNYRKHNAGEFNDILSFIYDNLNYSYEHDLPITYKNEDEKVEFNFWSHYDEISGYCGNRVIIYKKAHRLFIDMNYGLFHFYNSFILNRESMRKDDILLEEQVQDNVEDYYTIYNRK